MGSGLWVSFAGASVDECFVDAGKGAAAVPLCNGARLGGLLGAGGDTGPAAASEDGNAVGATPATAGDDTAAGPGHSS